MQQSLGERELDVMSVLWRGTPSTVAEVREALAVPLAYNTVLTILRNLEAKGFVRHTAEGRTFRYSAAVSEQAVRGSAVKRLVRKFFGGSTLGAMAHLVENEKLSESEIRYLQELIDDHAARSARKPKGRKP
ncbi:MAG: BlaI/MecI/CopY family transcriptional regulator [Gemmatimonadetes bacterium]|nr:BlaI/MecI/CopY family transcriptional regulator [Gemmatimonadota bacterium]